MRQLKLTFALLVALGCAKGREISLEEVVILPSLRPAVADASAEGGSTPSENAPALQVPDPAASTTPDMDEAAAPGPAAESRPDADVPDAATPPAADSGA